VTPAASKALDALKALKPSLLSVPMRARFAEDPGRFKRYSHSVGPLLLDYSKNLVDDAVMRGLFALARAAGVEAHRDRMFAGEAINTTENRPVLHVALRAAAGDVYRVEDKNVVDDVHAVLARMTAFADGVRTGKIAGVGGAFTDVVNIGIGGSDLGPCMAVRALKPYHDGPRIHFVSNVDGAHLRDTIAGLNPATTLFLIASKTFTTIETMTNAASARRWIAGALGEAKVGAHFAAISTAADRVAAFGIKPDRMFGFWDWVGGRYSLWSSIGLSLMIAIGPERFRAFLAGGREMDQHFRSAPLESNMPAILALVGVWHRNVMGYATHAVLPYDQRLDRLPAYFQQLDMESNGKRVALDGGEVGTHTGPILFGEPGTNGQHAFYQLLHQGTDPVAVDFLVAAHSDVEDDEHQRLLLANCLAQSEALMRGKTLVEVRAELAASGLAPDAIEKLAPHKVFPGSRPSSTLLYPRLDPHTLGMIIALYEHKVFVQGAIWGINSFDQWGVELGKQLATELLPLVEQGPSSTTGRDSSTEGLLAALGKLRSH
jgi:glucose-6-phosphate isomerase